MGARRDCRTAGRFHDAGMLPEAGPGPLKSPRPRPL